MNAQIICYQMQIIEKIIRKLCFNDDKRNLFDDLLDIFLNSNIYNSKYFDLATKVKLVADQL